MSNCRSLAWGFKTPRTLPVSPYPPALHVAGLPGAGKRLPEAAASRTNSASQGATAAAADSVATGEPPPICSRQSIRRRQALRADAPLRAWQANGIRWGTVPDSCSTSVAGHVPKAKGRALMASRYLPRRSAGKKAVALTVLFVTGAASGAVTVAAAGTAVAASTTHAMPTASPATGTSPRIRTRAAPAALATAPHGTATVPPPKAAQSHFGTSRPRIRSGSHSPGDRSPAANADGYIRCNG